MTVSKLIRVMFWAAACAFLADLLRRCWIFEAWSIGIVAAIALVACLWHLLAAIRLCLRKRLPADFVRPNTPKFPEQPRRGIR